MEEVGWLRRRATLRKISRIKSQIINCLIDVPTFKAKS